MLHSARVGKEAMTEDKLAAKEVDTWAAQRMGKHKQCVGARVLLV